MDQLKAEWSKLRNLTDVLCRGLDTDNSKNINIRVQQLSDYIVQAAKQDILRGRREDHKPYWSNHLQCLHDQLTETRKDLSSSLRQSSTTRKGLLSTKSRSRKPGRQEKTSSPITQKCTHKP